jgi:microcystin-dependent protein
MSLFFYKWSKTAASNATADAQVNMSEGMAPSAVNDGVRALMASAAGFRDDISGATVTGGTSTNYTLTTNQIFDSLANMSGMMIAFTPHTTNGAGGVNINVDGLGLKPIYNAPLGTLPAGTLIAGVPYVALYNNSDAAFYLHAFYGNPYSIPIGGSLDFWGATAPNSSFVFPYGQAVSRTTYSALFTLLSTTYGVGDGSSTFNLPDCRGRVPVGKDDMGGSAASRLTTAGGGVDGATLGAVGGAQNITLTSGQIPSLTSSGSNSISVVSTVATLAYGFNSGAVLTNGSGTYYGAGNSSSQINIGSVTSTGSNSISVSYTNGSQTATKTVQPSIVCNKLIRII